MSDGKFPEAQETFSTPWSPLHPESMKKTTTLIGSLLSHIASQIALSLQSIHRLRSMLFAGVNCFTQIA